VALYELLGEVAGREATLIVGLEGFIDAGMGARGAVEFLIDYYCSATLARFDTDRLVDYRARRPLATLVDGRLARLEWPQIELRRGQDEAGRHFLVLGGPEPDLAWREFARSVVELAGRLDVAQVVGLGAFPAPAPHTRPVRVAATSVDQELAKRVGVVIGTIKVPAGIEAVLEEEFSKVGIPAVGLWARVPHYLDAMSYPGASLALLEMLQAVAGLSFDLVSLAEAADRVRQKVDALISNSPEHQALVEQLERHLDQAEGNTMDLKELPSGDEIAAELERFLRGQSD
jgi:predicted ATP-grasp superfamily ATP-dependent carboligase